MKKSIMFGIAGLIIGIIISGSVASYAVNGNHSDIMKAYAIDTSKVSSKPIAASSGDSMTMAQMNADLTSKTGDAFDKAFISEMTMHHQGAIDMAKLALTNAKHQEIKDMASGIITAQTSEINQMTQWNRSWGYVPTTSSSSSSMNGMNM